MAVAARVLGVAAVLIVIAMYCYATARRLDGLHARVDAAGRALDGQLRRRSATVLLLVPELPVASAERVRDAVMATVPVVGLGHDREIVENALSRELAGLAAAQPRRFVDPGPAAAEVHDEALRASIARRFYNDAVRDALVVRDRRTVRWLRLAGHAPHPGYFEMDDDELPMPPISVAKRHTVEA